MTGGGYVSVMGGDGHGQTLIAGLIITGVFAIIIIGELTGRTLDPSTQVLIGSALTGVIGWYFGVRAHASGVHSATTNATATVEAVKTVTGPYPGDDTGHSADTVQRGAGRQ